MPTHKRRNIAECLRSDVRRRGARRTLRVTHPRWRLNSAQNSIRRDREHTRRAFRYASRRGGGGGGAHSNYASAIVLPASGFGTLDPSSAVGGSRIRSRERPVRAMRRNPGDGPMARDAIAGKGAGKTRRLASIDCRRSGRESGKSRRLPFRGHANFRISTVVLARRTDGTGFLFHALYFRLPNVRRRDLIRSISVGSARAPHVMRKRTRTVRGIR